MANDFSRKQLQVLAFPQTDYTALICDGAVRSGKTSVMSVAFLLWAMRDFDQQNFAICGKTVQTATKNIVKPLISMSFIRKRFRIKWARTESLLTVTDGRHTNYFYIYGGKDESSYMLIQGITLAGVFLDEVALMVRSFVEQATARCSVEGARFWFNCNPSDPQHWFKTEWIDQAEEKNALHLHFMMRDNPSLSENTLQRYERMYSGVFYQRYILGKWVTAEGTIYKQFADNPDHYLWDSAKPVKPWRIYIGVDFGGNGSQHAFVATGVLAGYAGIVGLMSQRVKAEGTTPNDLNRDFFHFCELVIATYGEINAVFCDSAEQVLIRGMQQYFKGTRLAWLAERFHNAAKTEINDRIRLTSAMIASGRFFITKASDSLRDALCNAVWSEKHAGIDERLDDGSTDIDTLDAFEYTIERDYKRYLSGGRS